MSLNIKCNDCGSPVKDGAKFCAQCGSSNLAKEGKQGSFCSSCGAELKPDAKFCGSCGEAVEQEPVVVKSTPKKKARQASKAKQPVPKVQTGNNIKWIAIAAVVVVVILFIQDSNQTKNPVRRSTPVNVENVSGDLQLEGNVREVAALFSCSCGNCNAEALETCTCGKAQEERQFIRDLLRKGQTIDQVVQAVNLKYGWLKAGANTKDAAGNKSLELQTKLKSAGTSVLANNTPLGKTLATFADQDEIIVKFGCPCGQCGIDELKDCSCGHPKGALEVKNYIAGTISQSLFSVDEIVEKVESKYGHRIR